MNFLKLTIRANGLLQFEGAYGVRLPLAAVPSGSDGRKAVYGVRPENFVVSDDGPVAQVQVIEPTESERKWSPGSATRTSSRCSANDTISGRATRSGSSPMHGSAQPFDELTGQRLSA